MTDLKINYAKKKNTLVTKLDANQGKIEELFKFYYDTLDGIRKDVLSEEYRLRDMMNTFEHDLKTLTKNLHKYSLIEFYHEELELKKKIANMSQGLEGLNLYLPQSRIICPDLTKAHAQIKTDLKERINSFIQKIDHEFALDNYKYVMDNVNVQVIKDIYRTLGPFDHFENRDPEENEMDGQRDLRTDFDERKSGALYRGQVNEQTQRPDGMGFKVYPNNAIFEGFFCEGQINGWGRGITPKGEVYQGPFVYDSMCGEGLFQWPDGRLFFGHFQQGKKNG